MIEIRPMRWNDFYNIEIQDKQKSDITENRVSIYKTTFLTGEGYTALYKDKIVAIAGYAPSLFSYNVWLLLTNASSKCLYSVARELIGKLDKLDKPVFAWIKREDIKDIRFIKMLGFVKKGKALDLGSVIYDQYGYDQYERSN